MQWSDIGSCIRLFMYQLCFYSLHQITDGYHTWRRVQYQIFRLLQFNQDVISGRFMAVVPKQVHKTIERSDCHVVLVGGGHSHSNVIRTISNHLNITVLSRTRYPPYSGMIPGFVEGYYSFDECTIDLLELCKHYNIKFIVGSIYKLDPKANKVYYTTESGGRETLRYDILSVNVGSEPCMVSNRNIPSDRVFGVKPLDLFYSKWTKLVQHMVDLAVKNTAPIRLVVVGGGAGGVEMILAMRERLLHELNGDPFAQGRLEFVLVTKGGAILPTHNLRTQNIFRKRLQDCQVVVLDNFEVLDVGDNMLIDDNGQQVCFDYCIWCTTASGQSWIRKSGLSTDDDGFIVVHDSLQSISNGNVFASGDCATLDQCPCPKAGVFAVRQSALLTKNLVRFATNQALEKYKPQDAYLSLISLGGVRNLNPRCVASKGDMALEANWLWHCKEANDRQYLKAFKNRNEKR